MKQEFEVSAEELLRTLKRRGIPLPSEMGAFITLEVCEQILDRPVVVTTQDVAISEIGEVLCATQLAATSEIEAQRALMMLLADLLVCAAPGVPSMLLELVERGPGGEPSLERLRDELEACLLPLNRGATRRVLARLLRETRKAGPSLRASLPPSAADMDAQFDALIGGARRAATRRRQSARAEPAVASPAAAPGPSADEVDAQFDALMLDSNVGKGSRVAPEPSARAQSSPQTRASRPERPAGLDEAPDSQPSAAGARLPKRAFEMDADPTAPLFQADDVASVPHDETDETDDTDIRVPAGLQLRRQEAAPSRSRGENAVSRPGAAARARAERQHVGASRVAHDRAERTAPAPQLDLEDLEESGPPPARLGLKVFGLCVVMSLGLLVAYASLGREGARGALGFLPQPSAAEPAAPPPPRSRPIGDLHVTSTPARAQVLLLIGQAPTLATDLPLGVTQEFVAVADGYAPGRALVPADAAWEEVDGQPRYELAIQASKASNELAKNNFGPTLLPRDVGTPRPRLGSVRIVTTPKGAKVYQLIGFTPDARVENLPLDHDYEVVVYLEGHVPVTRQILPADFNPGAGKRAAEIEVALPSAKAH